MSAPAETARAEPTHDSDGNSDADHPNPSRHIRDHLWELLAIRIGDGQAILVEPAANEQGWAVRTAGRDRWQPIDFDGLILSVRPQSN
ncbi:type I-E CRISPR-associated endoribonuclease Cas2 [Streptomyces sp. NBC_00269]|uniref:type I-E CRISPR-associated endoribonuclease Cas2 n=1 Tax=Streptomyces sp. NBC_00269 TaxID=2975696 RepID=UPI002E2D3CB3|nr:type I-E CRISPR-associated endoribonuclease Cas2 [Streptomyces sp. NBC_00269]